ncbi:MAG: zinc ribbon domain-containing protein [Candidatus Omnitrophota bacterium]
MPIYEYICLGCNCKFEYLLRGSEEIACPKCGKDNLKKLLSAFSFSSKDAKGNATSSLAGCGSCSAHNCSSCAG